MWNDHINKLKNRPTYFRFVGRMLGFQLPVISDNIVTLFLEMLDPENVGIGVGISLLSQSVSLVKVGVILPPPSG